MKRAVHYLILIVAIVLFPQESFAEVKGVEPMPFALTISGGISLGSYEAGVNWALVEYLKKPLKSDQSPGSQNPQNWKPELLSITGASAGSINAVMTAMNWCVDPAKRELLQKEEIESEIAVDEKEPSLGELKTIIDQLLQKLP